jgi:hypothetical protein
MRPVSGFEPPKPNRAGMMRLVIGILLLVTAVDAFSRGELLLGLARIGFGVLAGLLAYGTLPEKRVPGRLAIGVLTVSLALWAATWL